MLATRITEWMCVHDPAIDGVDLRASVIPFNRINMLNQRYLNKYRIKTCITNRLTIYTI